MKIVNVGEMRQIEQAADASGWSFETMMEHAGRAVATAVLERVTDLQQRGTLILVGPGNNGGDGLVAARYLHDEGCPVTVYCWKRGSEDDINYRLVQERTIPIHHAAGDTDLGQLRRSLQDADVIVDSLLGTGVTRPIKGLLAEILAVVGNSLGQSKVEAAQSTLSPLVPVWPKPCPSPLPLVVGVDCPSGLDCDTGALDPATLRADLTVTFANPKRGHFLLPGASACGELLIADIGTDPSLAEGIQLEVATPQLISGLLPSRPPDAHKGTFGRALLVVGSVSYTGAAHLAAASATRVGAGLVTLAVAESLHAILGASLHEPTWLLLPEETGVISPDAVRLVRSKASDYQALLLGCGLTQEKPAAEFVLQLLQVGQAPRQQLGFVRADNPADDASPAMPPLVIDADALNILAQREAWHCYVPPNSVLTPHPGEMARLCGLSTSDISADRWGLAQAKASEWQQVLFLKGAYSVIAAPDGRTLVLPFANPALATAGTGDVLAGAIVGMLAQGVPSFEAAAVAGYLHGLAGEMARQEWGNAGTAASDLLAKLPLAAQAIT